MFGAVLSVLSGFAVMSLGKRGLVGLLFYWCSVHFPCGAVGWSAVFGYTILWLFLVILTFFR